MLESLQLRPAMTFAVYCALNVSNQLISVLTIRSAITIFALQWSTASEIDDRLLCEHGLWLVYTYICRDAWPLGDGMGERKGEKVAWSKA